MLDQRIVSKIPTVVQYLCEEIVVGRVIHDDIGIFVVFDDAMESGNAGVRRRYLMQRNLAHVELSTGRQCLVGPDEAFYSI